MPTIPTCPRCTMDNVYHDGDQFICADCGHEWPAAASADTPEPDATRVVRDANGTALADGDSIVLIKDLKVKGASGPLKLGTKIKGIRIVDGDHEIDCKTEFGPMLLKAIYVKKV